MAEPNQFVHTHPCIESPHPSASDLLRTCISIFVLYLTSRIALFPQHDEISSSLHMRGWREAARIAKVLFAPELIVIKAFTWISDANKDLQAVLKEGRSIARSFWRDCRVIVPSWLKRPMRNTHHLFLLSKSSGELQAMRRCISPSFSANESLGTKEYHRKILRLVGNDNTKIQLLLEVSKHLAKHKRYMLRNSVQNHDVAKHHPSIVSFTIRSPQVLYPPFSGLAQ